MQQAGTDCEWKIRAEENQADKNFFHEHEARNLHLFISRKRRAHAFRNRRNICAKKKQDVLPREEAMKKRYFILLAAAFIITAYNTKAEDEYWGPISHRQSTAIDDFRFYPDHFSKKRTTTFTFRPDSGNAYPTGLHTGRNRGAYKTDAGDLLFYESCKSVQKIDGSALAGR